jgi:hypothetical protein
LFSLVPLAPEFPISLVDSSKQRAEAGRVIDRPQPIE